MKKAFLVRLAAVAACSALVTSALFVVRPARAVDEAGKGENKVTMPDGSRENWKPPLKKASDAGEKALARIKVPDDLKTSLWAAEPMLGDPNAIGIDNKGNIYVAETYRYHGGVIDIRGAMNWLEEDIACRTVEDRIAMVKRHANEGPGKEALLSPDSDRIVLLQDTTGSGKADKSTVFATGFNTVADGLGSGVFPYKGSVYYTCIPSLYRLKDTKGTGTADVKEVLQYGYGVRYAFLGHDLHGMVMGPDGRLYFSIGDRGANVTKTPDGRTVENIETGGVFRCNLDGTGLELFATGLRNPQELRFDNHGNLFTGDNNPDKGDPARWVYVTEDSDTGWREGYQNAEHMGNGGPWMAEQIWAPQGHSNAAYIVPAVREMGAGPSGLAYYPGTGMPDRYEDTFFLCDFRGGAQGSLIRGIRNKPKGAGFEVAEEKPFMERAAATDVDFGPDGAMYFSDWIDGWARPMAGRIYKIVDPKKADDPLVKEVKTLLAEGLDGKPVDQLVKLLGHKDMRIRQEAQFALAAKGADAVAAFNGVAQKGESTLARLHAIWGLGQVARKTPDAAKALIPFVADKDLEVRCQALNTLGDLRADAAYDAALGALKDAEPRAKYFAAVALGKIGNKKAVPAIFDTLKENNDQDPVLRHGCVAALAKLRDMTSLKAAAKNDSRAVRLGAVLALRRMNSASVELFLEDADAQVVLEAARAINDIPIDAALPKLAERIDKPLPANAKKAEYPAAEKGPKPIGTPGDWILWRAVNANFRVGQPENAKALATFAARTDVTSAIRVEALKDLGEWARPSNRDHITNQYRPLLARDAKIAKDAVKDVIEQIAGKGSNDVRTAAANLMRQFGLGSPETLAATVADAKAPAEVRVASLESLADAKAANLKSALDVAMKDKSDALRTAAIAIIGKQSGGVGEIAGILKTGTVREKQAVLTALGNAPGNDADPILASWLDQLLAGQTPQELQLELLEAAAKRKSPDVSAKLKQFEDKRDAKDPLSPYRETLAGGNVEAGHKIFRERADVSCIRCHVAQGEGGVVGPQLDGIAAKQTREYLLEAVVAPNTKIAPGFESVIVKTKDGKLKSGIVRKDDATGLTLLNPDAEPDKQVITIPAADITTRERGPSAMPEGIHKPLTKSELRDLIEWLASLKAEAKK